MRILHLDAGKQMRGGQWQALRLIEGLNAEGVESTLLARPDAPLTILARKRACRVEPLGLFRAFSLARRHDLIHAHDARSHTIAAIAGGAPLVVSRRVSFPIGSKWKYGRAAGYIAVSEHVKSVLMAGGVPPEKITVVPDGVPLLEPAKGDAVMALADSGDPLKGATLARDAARLAGVTLELTSDPERDLRRAAIFVYITHSEGLGSAALLAMSAGVAVVASNTGGLPEIVRHGETGLLVENRPEPIAAALRELTANGELARRLGAAGRRFVQENFTVGHMVRRTMEVYRQILS